LSLAIDVLSPEPVFRVTFYEDDRVASNLGCFLYSL
jgi:hypothetical protein